MAVKNLSLKENPEVMNMPKSKSTARAVKKIARLQYI
jgi:hypothetical protein